MFGLKQHFTLDIDYSDEDGSAEAKVITVMTGEECHNSAALIVCESIIDTLLNRRMQHS